MERHRAPRKHKCGAERNRERKEKQNKEEKVLSKTKRMTAYLNKPNDANLMVGSNEPMDIDKENSNIQETIDAVAEDNRDLHPENQISLRPSPENTVNEHNNKNNNNIDIFANLDIAKWPADAKNYISLLAQKGSSSFQNRNSDMLYKKSVLQPDGEKIRRCKEKMFDKELKNKTYVPRSWVCFSPSTGKIYCYHCKLFSNVSSQFTDGGYCDWKNAYSRFKEHENSKHHKDAVFQFTIHGSKNDLDLLHKKQIDDDKNYWRNVLKRVVSVIKFLSARNLPFRGDNEILGAPNNGNFLGLVELLAEYDEFTKVHLLKFGNCGKGNVNYLSPTIYEELIGIMSDRVMREIIDNIKKSKYYAISVDSTTDISHVNQLCVAIRYIENDQPIERFLTFFDNQGHSAEDNFNAIVTFCNKYDISLNDCRGQSYDNASVMSGRDKGLQAIVRKENHLALWIPCFGHSLNLVGTAAMTSSLETKKFFDFLEHIYVFFSSSSERHKLLLNKLEEATSGTADRVLVPKRVSTTRWASRAEAVRSIFQGYTEYQSALLELSHSNVEADGLFKYMMRLETTINIVFWQEVLQRINLTNLELQKKDSDLNTSIALLKSLKSYVHSLRDNFETFETTAKDLLGSDEYDMVHKRARKRNKRLDPLDYATSEDIELEGSQNFRVKHFLPVIDQLVGSLDQRISAYEEASGYFGFLRNLHEIPSHELEIHVKNLVTFYKDDIDNSLLSELLQLRELSKQFIFKNDQNDEGEQISFEIKLFNLIVEKNLKDMFSNTYIILKIYLVLMTTNVTDERSFSKLKLLKSYLRSSTSQDRLNSLAILAMENDLLQKLSFDDVINDFAEKKARKVLL